MKIVVLYGQNHKGSTYHLGKLPVLERKTAGISRKGNPCCSYVDFTADAR
ncbi:MAG: hypothetical protein ACI4K9_06980 [Candidatus Fimenecus sp.]